MRLHEEAADQGEGRRVTREQRDLLRRLIDVRVRERLSEVSRRGASPGGYVAKPARRVKS
jgi:hypothetical protein